MTGSSSLPPCKHQVERPLPCGHTIMVMLKTLKTFQPYKP
jgi:hypothetical protein